MVKRKRCWCKGCNSCCSGNYCDLCGKRLVVPPKGIKIRRCAGCGLLEGRSSSVYCSRCGRKFPQKRKLVTTHDLRWNIAKLQEYKSHHYSKTSYTQELEHRVDALRVAGATPDQIKTFRDLATELPITGGQFKRHDGT